MGGADATNAGLPGEVTRPAAGAKGDGHGIPRWYAVPVPAVRGEVRA
ncbi:MAG: hypothetical protein IPM08_15800 [Actinomycetales bacterium]|nr:hypothetical protein [Actinomycetales bacterium]